PGDEPERIEAREAVRKIQRDQSRHGDRERHPHAAEKKNDEDAGEDEKIDAPAHDMISKCGVGSLGGAGLRPSRRKTLPRSSSRNAITRMSMPSGIASCGI